MDKAKKRVMIGILALLFILASSIVYSQGVLDTALRPFDTYNPAIFYQNHWYIIDSFIYLMILLGVAQFSLSKQFPGRAGKAVVIGVGLSLALAASLFEYKNNFKLVEKLGPLAIIIVCVLFLWGVYKFAQSLGAGGKAFAMLAFAFLFFYLCAMLPSLVDWFAKNPNENIRLIWAVLNLVALIFLVWGVISLFSSLGGEGSKVAPWQGPSPAEERPGREPRPRPGEEPRPEPGTEPTPPGTQPHPPQQTPHQPTPQPPGDEDFYPVISGVAPSTRGTMLRGRIDARR